MMFPIITKMFIVLSTNMFNGPNHKKWVSLSNQKCMIQPTLINSHPNEYSHGFYYYPFVVNLERCVGSWNTLNEMKCNL